MTLLELCDALFNMQGAENSFEVHVECRRPYTLGDKCTDDEDLQRVRIVGLRLEKPDSARPYVRLLTAEPVQLKET